jgi:hypothetical protein
MKRWIAVALGALGMVVAGAVPGGAVAGPSVTVVPNTGLVDGQTVTVSGSGLTPGPSQVGIVECDPTSYAQNVPCDLSTVQFVNLGADGSFTTTQVVRKTITTSFGTFDCGVPGTCLLAVGNFNALGTEQWAIPLEFGHPVTGIRDCVPTGWQSNTDANGDPFSSRLDCIRYALSLR